MTIPPFPSQDLAKLVLGYLAEEQLMTAYDEFLQASPYLDALRNEYDRIFMTSLKNILAEYRAVKIYVETCKPLQLRKKLVHCNNLLEMVKLLVSYADVNKLQSQDISSEKIGISKQNASASYRQNYCEVCASLNLEGCSCCKQNKSGVYSLSHVNTSSKENSVETTALEDLPGNHVTFRRKQVKVLEKDLISESTNENPRQSISNINASNNSVSCNNHSYQTKPNEGCTLNSIVRPTDTPECREKIEEFNTILKKVCNTKSNADTRLFSIPETNTLGNRISSGSFQDFASGVNGQENRNIPVPDSSTSENTIAQSFVKDIANTSNAIPKDVNEHTGIKPCNTYLYPRIKAKPTEQKIKILSDIKVDSPLAAINNATSTPLMQTIVINGTPAYKQKLPVPNNNYTKDEIMAMPTIIVVPTSGPPPKMSQTKAALSQKIKKAKTKTVSSSRLLGPLIIDVSSSPVAVNDKVANKPVLDVPNKGMDTGLVKTVDVIKNASVPKDNTIPGSSQTNTPQGLPPVRKSSSTPRRNSHIRVLDFTTPRRILHETINENVPEKSNDQSVEIIVSRNPTLEYPKTSNCVNDIVNMSAVKVHKIETCHLSSLSEKRDIKPETHKKTNWDAELRVLAVSGEKVAHVVKKPRIRAPKKKTTKTENPPENNATTETKTSQGKRKRPPKAPKTKKLKLEEEEEEHYTDLTTTNETKVKPTFNIVAADLRKMQPATTKIIDTQNKSEEAIETPEAERISLQNEIGAKLNISDLLETPYKQALYDIQMETPKFIGSVLPDEPISDIKIMNIPTPRFFDTPKPAISTPYASRATDYSSGGSYYKPDEQDYLRIPDLECPATSSNTEPNIKLPKEKDNDIKKSSRPVRKCTKNVSYKAQTNKGKVSDDKVEVASTCSDSTSINSSFESSKENPKIVKTPNIQSNKENSKTVRTPKTPKDNKSKLLSKSELKKRLDSSKKRKSPLKKDKPNTFMKIKPRRPTPIKDNNKRTRKKSVQNTTPKNQTNKKQSGKEKTVQLNPVLISAPTKSRRKSSTPRKLNCTKQFNSESSADSPEMNVINTKVKVTPDQAKATTQDSDSEQFALRWSDDGSQDAVPRESECEDITKIKEYIETCVLTKPTNVEYNNGTLQVDLIKRGFDAETAKIIERDLLDTPSDVEQSQIACVQIAESKAESEKSAEVDTSIGNELQIVQDAEEDDDLVLSVYECNEDDHIYITYNGEDKDVPTGQSVTLKDTWSMEVCIDDGAPIRLRATSHNFLFDNVPQDEFSGYSFKETEVAVCSISNIDKLYTPLKDRRSQCYEIFDSTLTSLDTPLKISSPRDKVLETTEIEIVVEEEKVEDRADTKKRKRCQGSTSPEATSNENKKTKPEAQYLFNSTNIQNIDIESVLKKLHGPS